MCSCRFFEQPAAAGNSGCLLSNQTRTRTHTCCPATLNCRFFEQQPLDKVEAGREGERRLLYWLVEDGIKKR